MVNNRLHELCFRMSKIGTTKLAAQISKLAAQISWYPVATVREVIPRFCQISCQDHFTIIQLL
jgi:hypothetical protein